MMPDAEAKIRLAEQDTKNRLACAVPIPMESKDTVKQQPVAAPAVIRKLSTHLAQLYAMSRFTHYLGEHQDSLLFNPHPSGLEPLRSPAHYKQLHHCAITAEKHVTDRDRKNSVSAEIETWTHKGEVGKPHIIYFTGKTGHIADTGPAAFPVTGYDRYAGQEFLAELAKKGAGFTVVTMRGYGLNKGMPGEKGFRHDIKVFLDNWLKQPTQVKGNEIIIAGYSLGTANAAIAAAELTKRGFPPAMLVLTNGFSSMIERGKEFADTVLANPSSPKLALLKGKTVPENVVEAKILHHPFDTRKRIAELVPQTHICISFSSHDELVPNHHSKRLIEAARENHPVIEQVFDGYGHVNVPPAKLAQSILEAYCYSRSEQGLAEKQEMQSKRLQHMHDGVYMPLKTQEIKGSWTARTVAEPVVIER